MTTTLLGSALRSVRDAHGFAARELARRAGISHTQVSRVESGEVASPSREVVVRIAQALDRNPGPLLVLAGHLRDDRARLVLAPMFRPGAELPEAWLNESLLPLEEALAIVADARSPQEDLMRVAAGAFEVPESDETLWDPSHAQYAVIADVVLPLQVGRDHDSLVAVTCLTRGTLSEAARRRRNAARLQRRARSRRGPTNPLRMETQDPMNATSPHSSAPIGGDDLVAAIDARLAAVDQQLAAFDGLRQERDRLIRARRALVVGDHAGAEARLSATTVLAMLARNPGSTAGELVALLDAGDSAVRAHLHRARQVGRCAARERRWSVTERAVEDAATSDRSRRPTSSARRRGAVLGPLRD